MYLVAQYRATTGDYFSLLFYLPLFLKKNNLLRRLLQIYQVDYHFEIVIDKKKLPVVALHSTIVEVTGNYLFRFLLSHWSARLFFFIIFIFLVTTLSKK